MRNSIKLLLVILLATSLSFTVKATSNNNTERPIHEIHSMMVYNFMKYVHWPPNTTDGDFVIGVVGSEDVYQTLTKWYGTKNKGSQKITIKKFDSASQVGDCHVLYIGKSQSGSFTQIKAKTNGKSTLIITDKSGLGKKGSVINFKTVNNKLKFELNQSAVEKANLKVSGQLTGMAIVI